MQKQENMFLRTVHSDAIDASPLHKRVYLEHGRGVEMVRGDSSTPSHLCRRQHRQENIYIE